MKALTLPMGEGRKFGLTGFTIKIIAVILMTYDHIGMPYLGRLAAPLFVMMTVQGTMKTSNRVAYAFRLYTGFIAQNILNLITVYIVSFFTTVTWEMPNIFETLLLIVVLIWSIQDFRINKKLSIRIWAGVLVSTAISLPAAYKWGFGPDWLNTTLRSLFPNTIACEFGPLFILMGILMYATWNNSVLYSITYILISFAFPLLKATTNQVQWMMIFALPIMLLYNGNRGRSLKYFFYLYYPLHLFAINMLGCVMMYIDLNS